MKSTVRRNAAKLKPAASTKQYWIMPAEGEVADMCSPYVTGIRVFLCLFRNLKKGV
jgi:hypothetical protein